jgi:hypothetical protein
MTSPGARPTSLFFVASPLHYLVARTVARHFEAGSRCILVCYRDKVGKLVQAADWDQVIYAPWPRFDPLPGRFGSHRRLRDNLRKVAAAVGKVEEVRLHSPVFDTEAVNYFLRGLPRLCGAKRMFARILPDGLLNIQRYPLSLPKLIAQHFRRLRWLVSPELDYWCFSGDRIGSDAPFVDRIYTLPGFPHPYPASKVVELPPLTEGAGDTPARRDPTHALVVGQPLIGIGMLDAEGLAEITGRIAGWLAEKGFTRIDYKAHPRDPNHEFRVPGSTLLDIDEPLETYIAHQDYAAIVGVNSTTMFIARQICGPDMPIVSFGMDRLYFKIEGEEERTLKLMKMLSIQVL